MGCLPRFVRFVVESWFRAVWMLGLWLSVPVAFEGILEVGGLLFAVTAEWALAVASCDVRM